MAIFLSTDSDAKHTEGIGAMVQYQLHTYSFAKLNNLKYAFFGFKNMQHYQYFDINQKQFTDDINTFFNFPNELNDNYYDLIKNVDLNTDIEYFINKYKENKENILLEVTPKSIMKFADSNIEKIETSGYIKELREHLVFENEKKYFSNDFKNISIHIRKYTTTDCDLSSVREYYTLENRNKIINILKKVTDKFFTKEKIKIHVYSQGNEEEFYFLTFLNNDRIEVIFHIEEYPIVSLYHMINSDILIGANSSFSYISHLYGKTVNIFRNNFQHSLYKEKTHFFDYNGNLIG